MESERELYFLDLSRFRTAKVVSTFAESALVAAIGAALWSQQLSFRGYGNPEACAPVCHVGRFDAPPVRQGDGADDG